MAIPMSYNITMTDFILMVISDNGVSKVWSYDDVGHLSWSKETAPDNKWIRKDYTYFDAKVSSIEYTTQNGVLLKEDYSYANGHLTEGKINNRTQIFKLVKENSMGLPVEVASGTITRKYEYDNYGTPTRRYASSGTKVYMDMSYTIDNQTNNLSSRKDNVKNISESFGYDELNRLTLFKGNTVAYDMKGNITGKSDVGSFSYDIADKPYAVSKITTTASSIPSWKQTISYTSFHRPSSITENGNTAKFCYDYDYNRVKMEELKNGSTVYTQYYLADNYEMEKADADREKLYLFGDYYKSSAVYVKTGSTGKVYFLLRDYLGSIVNVVDPDGGATHELSYDAWGRLRNPTNQTVYTPGSEPSLFIGRGYCGHEHLTKFGLINMNARLYDPVLGRFLSPDPYVQMPEMSQNYNRFSYCLNNPLKYTDPDGELFFTTLFSAIVDFWSNIFSHGVNVSQYNWKRTENAWKLDMGMFKGNFGQVLNKWTFGIVNSLIGKFTADVCNIIGKVDNVTYLDGMAAVSGVSPGNSAFTIGHYSMGPKGYVADWRDHLFVHEYGHYIQTQRMGWLYFPAVAIPNLMSAAFTSNASGMEHDERWFEVDASNLGAKHFDRKYGSGNPNYQPNSSEFFNINQFYRGGASDYINPRIGAKYQDHTFEKRKKKLVFWDFIL